VTGLLGRADWSFPIPVAYGPGRIADIGAICADAGMTAPLVVTDRGSAELAFVGRVTGLLTAAGLRPGLFGEISPNPTIGDIAAGREAFTSGGYDGIVAIGGGSGMDGGKAISLVGRNDRDLMAFDFDADAAPVLADGELVPVVCVPTTAGTGAETESTAMVTDPDRGVKICVWHPSHRPVAAVLDPELTLGLPAHLTAWTGVDALVHAIEAYSVPSFHPLCDGLAVEAIRLIWPALPRAVEDGADLAARAAMLVGSCLAGVSFLKGLGLVHAMSHMIGAVYDTHHGLTNAVMLPPVLEFNRGVLGQKVAVMASAAGIDDVSHDGFAAGIDGLLARLEIPASLTAIGVGSDRLGELATKALGDAAAGTNPRLASHAEVEALLRGRL
jgi:alcohol dehydrogenase class IV